MTCIISLDAQGLTSLSRDGGNCPPFIPIFYELWPAATISMVVLGP
jgi:hypothetical protein